jgi:hypothetical protein
MTGGIKFLRRGGVKGCGIQLTLTNYVAGGTRLSTLHSPVEPPEFHRRFMEAIRGPFELNFNGSNK